MIFEYVLNLGDKGLEAQALKFPPQSGAKHIISRERTCRADIMCSGAMVFLDSFSHISFASDERRWMNSTAEEEVNVNATEMLRILVLPTQHSITRSRVSFAHATSSGNNSKQSRRDCEGAREGKSMSSRRSRVARHPAAGGGDALKKREEKEYLMKMTCTLNHFCHSRPGQRQIVITRRTASLSVGHG